MNRTTNIATSEMLATLLETRFRRHPDFKMDIVVWDELPVSDSGWDNLAKRLIDDPLVKIVVMGDYQVLHKIRQARKDIFLVGIATTLGFKKDAQYARALGMCKNSSCNLVFSMGLSTMQDDFDFGGDHYMIVAPEEASYHGSHDIANVVDNLVDMSIKRSHLTFTRSTVIDGALVPWSSEEVPMALRTVVNHCIRSRAYKVFNGSTVGHFAVKLGPSEFLTSKRKSDFNDLDNVGLVRIKTDGPDNVYAFGAKPSVGGQSQRIVFGDHPGLDCIVHAHVPFKEGHPDDIPVVSQRDVECGSHECGNQTSKGLKQFGNLKAVMLDNHGPNIVFSSDIYPQEVIDFIERNFDLAGKTGGYVV